MSSSHLVCVGIKGNPPYMDHQLSKAVRSESTWTFGPFCLEIPRYWTFLFSNWVHAQMTASLKSRSSKYSKRKLGCLFLCKAPFDSRHWIRIARRSFQLSRGHESLDAATEMDVKKDILLERFQEEVDLFPSFVRHLWFDCAASRVWLQECNCQWHGNSLPPLLMTHEALVPLKQYLRFLMPQSLWVA